MMKSPVFEQLLRAAGLKVTSGRLALLRVLSKQHQPLLVSEIATRLPELDQVTIYRALIALTKAGIVQTVDVKHAYTRYELVATKKHHHHAICDLCGKIEDIELCFPSSFTAGVAKQLHDFSSLTGHSLEFIGRCHKCTT